MSDSYKTDSKSNELALGRQSRGDHLFVAESATMHKYGLPSFDTESFKYWLDKSRRDVFVPNPEYQVDPDADFPILVEDGIYNTLLAYNDAADGTGSTPSREDGFINLSAWRTKGRNGEYVFFEKFSDWEFEDTFGVVDPAQPGRIWTSAEIDLIDVPIVNGDVDIDDQAGIGQQTFLEYIIILNQYINSLIDKDPTGRNTDVWDVTDNLRREFLVDVQSSKTGCLSWTAKVKFRTESIQKTPEGQITSASVGTKVENTNFRLYLFDVNKPLDASRRVTLKNLDYVGKRSHYDTGYYSTAEDGKLYRVPDLYSPRHEVAGEVDMTYTDFLGRWESGTPQVIAVMSTDLPAAEGVAIEDLENLSVPQILDNEAGQEIVFGSAIPIHMQNVNPRQWSPVYNEFEETRKIDNFTKAKLKVGNIAPVRFARGDMVVLNRIEGVWFPIGLLSEGSLAPPEQIENRDPKWEFMYLMTNQQWHFKDAEFESVTPDEYEKGFYVKYYLDDIFPENRERYDLRFISAVSGKNEYYQLNSWDMMGDSIGGTRTNKIPKKSALSARYFFNEDGREYALESSYLESLPYDPGVNGNSLSNTEYYRDVDDDDYDDEVRNTYPFFGCTFPDGYNVSDFLDKMITNEKDGEGTYFSVVYPQYNKREFPHFYPVSGNVLSNNNDVRKIGSSDTHQELGMFYDPAKTALKHLPADIATNASPSGRYGYPITDAAIFDITDDTKSPNRVSFSGDIHDFIFQSGDKLGFQDRYGWVFERDKSVLDDPSGQRFPTEAEFQDSAYDLQPTRFTRLQFRPLSKELYSFLERSNIGTTFPGNNKGYTNFEFDFNPPPTNGGALGEPDGNYQERGEESNRLWQGNGFNSPISETSVRRNLLRLEEPVPPFAFGLQTAPTEENPNPSNFIGYGLVGTYGLQYGSDLPGFIEDELEGDKDPGYPFLWWAYGWMDEQVTGGQGTLSAGGLGIIGATMSLRTVGTLTLTTENVNLEDFPVEGGGTQRSLNLGDYDEPNTSDLFMRCYQHWPRELTLYDPRYFVVHHFNPGVGPYKEFFDIATVESGVILKNFAQTIGGITQSGVDQALKDAGKLDASGTLPKGYAQPSGWFPIRKQLHGVDLKVVTKWTGGFADVDTKIYGDATYDTGEIGEENKVREKDDWWFNSYRRGKLLPYSYRYRTIGIKSDNVLVLDRGDTVRTDEFDIIITVPGEGYSVDEEFTAVGGTGGGTIFKVTEVDTFGGIIGIQVRSENDQGFSYAPGDFRLQALLNGQTWENNTITFGDELDSVPPIISRVTIQPLTQGDKPPQGTGFSAYVVRGTVVFSPLLTDQKPKEALDARGPIRLSAGIQDNLSANATNSFNITSVDPDNSYDLFFRYHNDISHVGYGSRSQRLPQARDQHTTLTITNNIGAGAGAGDDINFNDPFFDFGGTGGGGDDSFFGFLDNSDGDGTIGGAGGAGGGIDDFGFFN